MEKLQKQLLKDYILQVPGRPFEEVVEYAKELGIHDELLREVILALSKSQLDMESSTEPKEESQVVFEGKSILFKEATNVKKQVPKKGKDKSQDLIPLSEADLSSLKPTKKLRLKITKNTFKIPKINKHIIGFMSIAVAVLFFFLIFTNGELNIFKANLGNRKNTPREVLSQNTIENRSPFSTKLVYANQKIIDPKHIFSSDASKITLEFSGTPKREVFGFFPYWMLDAADKIDLDGITTLSLFGISVDGKGNVITVSKSDALDGGWDMWQDRRLDSFIKEAKKRKIRVVLTIKSFRNNDIEGIVENDEAQKTFIANSIQLVNLKSLDGINIDFEYTGTTSAKTRFAFTRLIANLGSELKRLVPSSTLSVDTYLKSGGSPDLFDVQLLSDLVDEIVVMGYDVHTPSGDPGPVAPMEGDNGILGYMQSYLERVPPDKLILAVPYYGYDWPIKEDTQDDKTKYIKVDGDVSIVAYAEIVSRNDKYEVQWDETAQTPFYRYADPDTKQLREVHFDNTRSLGIKFDYINNKNLKGVGIWALGYDGLKTELKQLIFDKFAK